MTPILTSSVLLGLVAFGTTRIEVSPEGPLPSLKAARDEIRARRAAGTLSGPVTVAVKAGRYECAVPLVLAAADGGTDEAPVRYVAEGTVTLDAGRNLPPGRPLEASVSGAAARIPDAVRAQVRWVDLSPLGLKDLADRRLVGADGTPYVRARYPNAGWMKFPKITVEQGKGSGPFRLRLPFADDRVASWADEPDVRGIGFPMHDWAPANWRVPRIDAAAKEMEVEGTGYGFRTDGRWYASHVLRELDEPGEYYVDAAGRTLYYVPRPCDAGRGLSLVAGGTHVRAKGVSNVSFEGFAFANAQGTALEFVGCTNVLVTGGAIRNCGGAAVARESANCRFEGIDAAHFEGRGFALSGGDAPGLVKSGNAVANCRIRDWGRAYDGYSGAVSMSGCGARLTGCDISEGAHGAVFFGGTEHLIESNEIHDVCLESGEMGAVYTGRNWAYVGNRIVGNRFHDLPKTCRQPTRAIMLDDGVGSIVIVSNRFERCAEGISMSGFANVVEDNVFVDCRPALGLWAAWVLPDCFSTNIRNVAQLIQSLESAPVDSPVWKARFPWLALMREAVRTGRLRDPLTRTRIRNNVFVTSGDEQIHWVRPRDKSPDGYLVEGNVTRPRPSPQLLKRWKSGVDVIGIVHYTVNTYTDREWGYGSEKPTDFNPSAFDAEQIVRACRDGGIRGLVIVAKHHDGFCLWPTATTGHNISRSPFRNGKGDYVKEMERACRKYGVKFGVYCSPWDRNNADYATAKYVKTYHRQVLELNDGRYGEIFEMWFDGANGGDGYYGGAWERRSIGVAAEYYDFKSLLPKIRALQPDVCFFGGSPTSEFKWPGNESGVVRPESGATQDDGTFRVFEADFPLRPGWFYHASQDGFSRSGEFLMKIYLRTVGNGATMDIGIAPDRRGLLSDEDVGCLARFTEIRQAFFSRKADSPEKPFNVIVMKEDITEGERVEAWRLTLDGRELASGGRIGMKRIRVLDAAVSGRDLRLEVVRGEAKPEEIETELYLADADLVRKVMSSEEPKRPPSPFERRGVLTSNKGGVMVYMMKHPHATTSLVLTPDADALDGTPVSFTLAWSKDGETWTDLPGAFSLDNVAANPVPQTIALPKEIPVKYLRLKVLRTLKDGATPALKGVEFQ